MLFKKVLKQFSFMSSLFLFYLNKKKKIFLYQYQLVSLLHNVQQIHNINIFTSKTYNSGIICNVDIEKESMECLKDYLRCFNTKIWKKNTSKNKCCSIFRNSFQSRLNRRKLIKKSI